MVGGLDRYFQIARCLRDEDLRGNRQFEFMQYDMEMSFAGQADVMAVVTEAVSAAVEAVTGAPLADVPSMTWAEAMERYGSDKPDVRFGMELTDLADAVAGTEFKAFHADAVKGICVPGARRRVALHARRPRRPGQAARRRRAGVDARPRRRRRSSRRWPSSSRSPSRPGSSARSAPRPATSC